MSIPVFVGDRFNRLVVVAEVTGHRRRMIVCRCDCGVERTLRLDHVRGGLIKSCGCYRREACLDPDRVEKRLAAVRTHGGYKDPEYGVWESMKARCENPKHENYHRYGGRGIAVCERWKDYSNFIADMGPRPTPLHTIDRVNNELGYEPGNCRWATHAEQMRNTRRNINITIGGVTKCLADWARERGIYPSTVRLRILRGIAPEKALT